MLTNKSAALKARGVDKYNAAIQNKDEAARTAGIDAAKADFKNAAESADKAFEFVKKEPAATDPNDQKRHEANKYTALNVRAEAYRLYVSKGDPSQADAGVTAFQDYMAVETDAAKKTKAQIDLAQMLLDAGAADKAFVEYQTLTTRMLTWVRDYRFTAPGTRPSIRKQLIFCSTSSTRLRILISSRMTLKRFCLR